jgi:hypothetical protein
LVEGLPLASRTVPQLPLPVAVVKLSWVGPGTGKPQQVGMVVVVMVVDVVVDVVVVAVVAVVDVVVVAVVAVVDDVVIVVFV